MLTDKYLIEYLIENGYTREEIESPEFNIDSLRDDFSMPIELSKVTNLDELRLFFVVNSSFLISKEDLESGKVYKVSQMLIDYKLIGNEPDLKLDKIFINTSNCGIRKNDETHFYGKNVAFENIDFSDTEFIMGDMPAQNTIEQEVAEDNKSKIYIIKLGQSLEDNADFSMRSLLEKDLPTISFERCSNLDLLGLSHCTCIINDANNIGCSEKSDFYSLSINNSENIDLSNVNSTIIPITLTNFEELDLARLPVSCRYVIEDIEKCFSTKSMEFTQLMVFTNARLAVEGRNISFNELSLNQVSFLEGMTPFSAQTARVTNCDFNVVKNIDVSKKLVIDNCFNADVTMEELIDRNYEEDGFSLKATNIAGYDIRRGLRTLDLKEAENKDLLDSPHKLREVLKDNKYLVSILVPESLTDDQKRILRELAPNVNYSYEFDDIKVSVYELSENTEEHVTFDEFMEADMIFDEIVSGIDPSWSELEKFKYLYNALGKRVSYDINVLNEKNEDRDSYNRANLIARNPFSSILTRNGVCAGYSEMFQYVCRKVGLICDMENDSHLNHRYNIIEYTNDDGERVKSYCDLTWDAIRTKYNSRCQYFCFGSENKEHDGIKCKDAVKLPEEKVKEIDKSIGYEYMVDRYMALAKEAKEIEGMEGRAKFLLDAMMKVQDISNMSNHEIVKMAWILLTNSGVDLGDSNIANAFIRKDERQDKSVRDILWIKGEGDKEGEEKYLYYTFNSTLQSFKPLEPEVIEELLASGMLEFYKDQKLPGFENWMSEKEYKEMRNSSQDR